jgi:hypothetical protein
MAAKPLGTNNQGALTEKSATVGNYAAWPNGLLIAFFLTLDI